MIMYVKILILPVLLYFDIAFPLSIIKILGLSVQFGGIGPLAGQAGGVGK